MMKNNLEKVMNDDTPVVVPTFKSLPDTGRSPIVKTDAQNHNVYTQDILRNMNAYSIDVHGSLSVYDDSKQSPVYDKANYMSFDEIMFKNAEYLGEYRSPHSSYMDKYGDGNVYRIRNGNESSVIVTYDSSVTNGKNVPCDLANDIGEWLPGRMGLAQRDVNRDGANFADALSKELVNFCKQTDERYVVRDKDGVAHDARYGYTNNDNVYVSELKKTEQPMTVTEWRKSNEKHLIEFAEKANAENEAERLKRIYDENARKRDAQLEKYLNRNVFQRIRDSFVDKIHSIQEHFHEKSMERMGKQIKANRGLQAENTLGVNSGADTSKDGPDAKF